MDDLLILNKMRFPRSFGSSRPQDPEDKSKPNELKMALTPLISHLELKQIKYKDTYQPN
jgi:hypothetical protein